MCCWTFRLYGLNHCDYTIVVNRYGSIIIFKIGNRSADYIFGCGDSVAVGFLKLVDCPCLTAFEHFEDVKQYRFFLVYFALRVVVEHHFFNSDAVQAHLFDFIALKSS